MQVEESYKYVGVVASFTAWLAIAAVLYSWPIVRSKSISKHVSAYKKAWLLFAPVETLALLLFYVFMIKWFIPALALSSLYKILVTLALILELVTTWVPDTDGIKHKVHHFTAYSAAWILPLLNILIVTSTAASMAVKVAAAFSAMIMITIIYKFLITKTAREEHLIYQSVYFACFHIPLLTAIFTAH